MKMGFRSGGFSQFSKYLKNVFFMEINFLEFLQLFKIT